MCSDGLGGAIISCDNSTNVIIQRLNNNGIMQWGGGGTLMDDLMEYLPYIISGGALLFGFMAIGSARGAKKKVRSLEEKLGEYQNTKKTQSSVPASRNKTTKSVKKSNKETKSKQKKKKKTKKQKK